jgi:excisionase family DNA binding protein
MSPQDLVADGLLTVRGACDFLGISRTSLWRLMDSGQVAFCYWQRSRRIPKKALIAFAAGRVIS